MEKVLKKTQKVGLRTGRSKAFGQLKIIHRTLTYLVLLLILHALQDRIRIERL